MPLAWTVVEHAGETLIVKANPDGEVPEAFRVATTTKNARVIALHDWVLFEGNVLEVYYHQATDTVELHHGIGGVFAELSVRSWLDAPVVVLERLDSAFPRPFSEVFAEG